MSIRSSLQRSKDDNLAYSKKSYSSLNIRFEILDAKEYIDQDPTENMRKRLYDREFSVDNVQKIFKIYTSDSSNITVNQIRDFFDDIGFNTDVAISDVHNSDIMMVYNIGGFLMPFYSRLVNIFFKNNKYKNFLLSKFGPGKRRLHCRIYDGPDGNWYLTSHVDAANWLNFINPAEVVRSHLQKGTGDYTMGTKIMEEVFNIVSKRMEKKEKLFVDIDKIYRKEKGKNAS